MVMNAGGWRHPYLVSRDFRRVMERLVREEPVPPGAVEDLMGRILRLAEAIDGEGFSAEELRRIGPGFEIRMPGFED